ncbi:hypothetical protein FB451DRAFT_1161303 [Mycena latifolia]|nr:hypothetical protein FB451DRAFT_1161303 [Mycena latifolia]
MAGAAWKSTCRVSLPRKLGTMLMAGTTAFTPTWRLMNPNGRIQSRGPLNVDLSALVWEINGHSQTWLTLDTGSPFSIYVLMDGSYIPRQSRLNISWVSWIGAQLRRIRRESRHRSDPGNFTRHRANGKIITEDEWFHSRPRRERIWTAEDEFSFTSDHAQEDEQTLN